MIVRFCLYSILKNLRFADPFLVLFLLHLGNDFLAIGSVLGFQHLITGTLEVPFGLAADRWGRRRSLALCFLFYAASFALYAALTADDRGMLIAAVTLYGVAEALRTGSHKAIILDWLDQRGERARATGVIGLARSFSKASSATAALAGGLILYYWQAYPVLFWMSLAPAVGGFFLMLTYPRSLEGEHRRAARTTSEKPGPWLRLDDARALLRQPGSASLLVESVAFESQVKIILKYYLQPFLEKALLAMGHPVLGVGAIWIGVTEFVRDQAGAASALMSGRVEGALGGGSRVLRGAYLGLVGSAVGIGLAARFDSLWLGIALLIGITVLQNVRRPVFVSAFNEITPGSQRATALSVESLARTVSVATLLPVTGFVADGFGLWAAFTVVCGVLLLVRVLTGRAGGRSGRAGGGSPGSPGSH